MQQLEFWLIQRNSFQPSVAKGKHVIKSKCGNVLPFAGVYTVKFSENTGTPCRTMSS